MTIGVIVAHIAGRPEGDVVNYLNWIPRGWLPQSIGQLLAFGASQLLLLGMVMLSSSRELGGAEPLKNLGGGGLGTK